MEQLSRPRLSALPSRLQPAPQRAAVSSVSWRAGKEGSTARGYGYRWQQYRIHYLAAHPLCVMCEGKGLIAAATVVDHIAPHQGDMKIFWDEGNHQSLCKPCHDSDKARQEGEQRQGGVG